jgi:hypothetical protein
MLSLVQIINGWLLDELGYRYTCLVELHERSNAQSSRVTRFDFEAPTGVTGPCAGMSISRYTSSIVRIYVRKNCMGLKT